ncbi:MULTISPECIES: Flp family type IVb pilin [unclassified Sphingosinithalassobacter]|uniref:Flp family type IVb pilin n=1 Tax=unclassified Sphingosinithalassobacter TaxID=2676235 RepID=UPI00165E642C|nr:Flp family type IVb pilin [Sphingosinithalassobacter sp. CS137]
MRPLLNFAKELIHSPKAATAVEYGFILALIVVAIIASIVELGGVTSGMWNNVSAKVQTAG